MSKNIVNVGPFHNTSWSKSALFDNENNLWISQWNGSGGLSMLENEQIIKRITIDDGLPNFRVTDFVFSKNNNLWISTPSGLAYYDFGKKYGNMVRSEYSECRTAYKLDKVLRHRRPAICMTPGILKQWFLKYSPPASVSSASEPGIRITSRKELESRYGHVLTTMADQYPTPFKPVSYTHLTLPTNREV